MTGDASFGVNDKRKEETESIKTVNDTHLKHEEETIQNVKASIYNKIDNITGIVTEKIVTTATPNYAKKNFLVYLSQFHFFQRLFDPLERLNRLRYFHSNLSETQEILKKKEGKEEDLNTTLIIQLGNFNMNETDMAMHNSSMTKNKENFFRASISVLLNTLEFVGKVFLMVLLAFMIMLLSMAIGLLVIGGVFLGLAYLLYILKYLCKLFVLGFHSKNMPENRHNKIEKTSSVSTNWLAKI